MLSMLRHAGTDPEQAVSIVLIMAEFVRHEYRVRIN